MHFQAPESTLPCQQHKMEPLTPSLVFPLSPTFPKEECIWQEAQGKSGHYSACRCSRAVNTEPCSAATSAYTVPCRAALASGLQAPVPAPPAAEARACASPEPLQPFLLQGPPGPPSTRHLPAQASARLRHPSSLPPHTCLPGPRSHPAQRHPEASVHGHPPAGEPGESELNLKCTGWRVTLGMGGAVENEGTGRLAHRCADRCIAATRQKLDRDYFLFFPMPAWAGITGCAK